MSMNCNIPVTLHKEKKYIFISSFITLNLSCVLLVIF